MPIDVESLPDDKLHNLIENHRKQKATSEPTYLTALREWEARKGKGLNFDKSLQIIRAAAKERRFLSYKELADASGADWSKVHYPIFEHLGHLLEYAHRNNMPLLTAIVVTKLNVTDGKMEADTLKGFVTAARDLGYSISNEEAFLREQQDRVFSWAAENRD